MANYMTMVFDPMAPIIKAAKTEQSRGYADRLQNLSKQLDGILADKKMTFLELMNAVAVGCNDTLPTCEIHNRYRVGQHLVDYLWNCGMVCPTLLRQLEIWQNWHSK